MKNDTPERSVNRPFCHQSVNPTFSVRVWKKLIWSRKMESCGWKLTKAPTSVLKMALKRKTTSLICFLIFVFWKLFCHNFWSILGQLKQPIFNWKAFQTVAPKPPEHFRHPPVRLGYITFWTEIDDFCQLRSVWGNIFLISFKKAFNW